MVDGGSFMSGVLVGDDDVVVDIVVGILSSLRNLSKKLCTAVISELPPLFSGGAKSRLTPKDDLLEILFCGLLPAIAQV